MAIWRDDVRRDFFAAHRADLDRLRKALLEAHECAREAVFEHLFDGFCYHCFRDDCNGSCENDE